MREIKFRAWDGSKMFQVAALDFTLDYVEGFMLWKPSGPDKETRVYEDASKCVLMQYSGLKDRNGKDIYEGDILQWREKALPITVETFHGIRFMWGQDYLCHAYAVLGGEVIGNIHENPDLLRVRGGGRG